MRVVTSNLAIRFYKSDGWTEEALNRYVKFSAHKEAFKFFDDGALSYWLTKVGTKLDIPLLMGVVTEVSRGFDDYPEQTDQEHLEDHN